MRRNARRLEVRAAEYAAAFEARGIAGMRALLESESQEPHVRSLFVHIVGPGGEVTFTKVPQNWIEGDTQVLVPDGWGSWQPRRVQSMRVPRDEQRDLTVVSRALPGGELLQVARSTDNQAVLLQPLRRTMWIAGPMAVILTAGAGAWFAWRAIRPVRAVAATAHRIVATGDLSARVEGTKRDDEVGELVRQFNTLLERNGNLLRAMREALDNVAHDLRTPLTRLRAGAEMALQQADNPAGSREALADCIEETDRIKRLLETLLDISAAESGVLKLEREPVEVGALLREVADLYVMVAEEKSIAIEVAPVENLTVPADPTRICQVMANLVEQCRQIHPGGWKGFAWGGEPRGPDLPHSARHRARNCRGGWGEDLATTLPWRSQPLAARTRPGAQRRKGAGGGPRRARRGGQPAGRRRGVHRGTAGGGAKSGPGMSRFAWWVRRSHSLARCSLRPAGSQRSASLWPALRTLRVQAEAPRYGCVVQSFLPWNESNGRSNGQIRR